jgi:hypothetical protein
MITVGHVRVRRETGAQAWLLFLAIASTMVVFITFLFTTLVHERATIIAIVVILLASIAEDFWWKGRRGNQSGPSPSSDDVGPDSRDGLRL